MLALVGALGTGKTLFVRGLAEALGVDPAQVASPTFTIANLYETSTSAPAAGLVHVDLYRVESEAALEAAGFVDLLDPGAVVAVEWAERFPSALPRDHLELRLARGAEFPEDRAPASAASGAAASPALERRLCARAHGPLSRKRLEGWAERLGRVEGIDAVAASER